MGEAHRCSKENHVIPKADGVSNNRSIYAAERQNCCEKTPTKNCRSCFQKEKSDANSHHGKLQKATGLRLAEEAKL
ncbi:15682_t:CDS:2 [Gigaspora margarita]|uniref:15682_t:CDS:1 n=1 Tax=Gigaspora margarita TaxID=4874 RepID=A0ABN7UKQ0_GIGMA|nr:15682_t:CDS:2 [Gigaspora margarita]